MGCIKLYHGSKSGIRGDIHPISRDKCDFGRGFYMGTEKEQPLTLICNYADSKFYQLEFNLSGLNVLDTDVGLDWALLIAYNRGKMENIKGTALYRKYKNMTEGYDVIIGAIANDRMFVVLDQFFSGGITDSALVHSLSALSLGKQYVAITDKACDQIKILEETCLTEVQRNELKIKSRSEREEGIRLAEQICRKYRREGRFFDEIIAGGDNGLCS